MALCWRELQRARERFGLMPTRASFPHLPIVDVPKIGHRYFVLNSGEFSYCYLAASIGRADQLLSQLRATRSC